MCAVELVEDPASKQSFSADRKIGIAVNREAVARGLFSRVKGDCYLLAPPIVTTESQLDKAVDIVAESVRSVLS